MAKKRRRRRASLLTKAINIGVLALAFAKPIDILLKGVDVPNQLVFHASAGLARLDGVAGRFNKDAAAQFYGPMVAAIILKKAISMVRRTARV